MAELTPKERLQPALLDRLTDSEPRKQQEPRENRVLSLKRLREAVLRDLAWLFNANNLASVQGLEYYPLVSHSVLNYGIPDMAGRTVSTLEITELERALRQAVCDFEPRILRHTVKVTALPREEISHNTIAFEISGELWAQPAPLPVILRTELDLEDGEVSVTEGTGLGGV